MRYPYELVLKPSRLSFYVIVTLHWGVAIVFMLQGFSPLWLAVLPLLVASAWFAWRRELSRRGLRLWLAHDGRLMVDTGDGLVEVTLRAGVDFGQIVWLSWSESGGTSRGVRFPRMRSVMLLPDNVAAGSWRRFRIWLRHKALVGVL